MTTAATPLLQLIEQRIALLAALAETFAAARLDVVRLDVSGLERRISEQDRLCSQIRSVDSTLDQMQRRCSAYLAVTQSVSQINALNQINLSENFLNQDKFNLSSQENSLIGVDPAKAASDLVQAQVASQSVLSAAARVLNLPTLLNFLK